MPYFEQPRITTLTHEKTQKEAMLAPDEERFGSKRTLQKTVERSLGASPRLAKALQETEKPWLLPALRRIKKEASTAGIALIVMQMAARLDQGHPAIAGEGPVQTTDHIAGDNPADVALDEMIVSDLLNTLGYQPDDATVQTLTQNPGAELERDAAEQHKDAHVVQEQLLNGDTTPETAQQLLENSIREYPESWGLPEGAEINEETLGQLFASQTEYSANFFSGLAGMLVEQTVDTMNTDTSEQEASELRELAAERMEGVVAFIAGYDPRVEQPYMQLNDQSVKSRAGKGEPVTDNTLTVEQQHAYMQYWWDVNSTFLTDPHAESIHGMNDFIEQNSDHPGVIQNILAVADEAPFRVLEATSGHRPASRSAHILKDRIIPYLDDERLVNIDVEKLNEHEPYSSADMDTYKVIQSVLREQKVFAALPGHSNHTKDGGVAVDYVVAFELDDYAEDKYGKPIFDRTPYFLSSALFSMGEDIVDENSTIADKVIEKGNGRMGVLHLEATPVDEQVALNTNR